MPLFGGKSKARVSTDRLKQLADPAPAPKPKSRRTAPRKDSWAECSLMSAEGAQWKGVIIDVSRLGARVRFRHRSQLPGRVRIVSPRYKLNRIARVVWQDDSDAGLEFEAPKS